MKILLVGSGGREHALGLGLHADPECTELHVAPGNPGIAEFATCHALAIADNHAIVDLAQKLDVDLVVIGPEVPLVNGVCDLLRAAGISVFGPSKAAAQLEGSKTFAKEVMADAGVPTAHSFTCTTQEEIEKALDTFGAPYVVKDDGLAAGKGVVVTRDRQEALDHARACDRVVIEEFLDGPEVSLFGISDGKTIIALQPAQDFKRANDNDLGLNTGGMGAYSPLPWAPSDIIEDTHLKVLAPMIAEMAARGTPFVGLLYAGLALTDHGTKVIEFNARFGDPETQALIPLLKTPLAQLLYKAATRNLEGTALEWRDESAVTVVLAAQGYPSAPQSGDLIGKFPTVENTVIYHAGTTRNEKGLVSSGGRVLTVTGTGSDLTEARDRAYRAISHISLEGSFYRSDIAFNASVAEKGN
ncbi:MAG: phosphoribosylamine--glycine ligase [Actinobacteria bacterium]|uniref:phosphoribosylamine--glycine ligase n=1 Tax=freshwater metagenome TaxID=449393 RepID=A0A6J7W690_9ZZZZ|nr:phosphoribosylamine--glycine ligase [Actinomycetota bacterium]MSX72609.1 phosphoribosylamine--glycine ligase [Actinomycetota bacterium]MSY70261.1 phosphoribosylamine--glycine ligase [Actinomycetota bacterium]MTA76586.1 phosphoribosylamine--glycine ligase [Actinomycetota bacterium]